MINFIAELLGKLIEIIYRITSENYGLSIIIFTIITKLILLPLNIKQVKSTEAINKIKPEYDKIMEKYKNNKEKQAEEITKLYADNKISPMGGCLLAIVQIPIILAMFYIVKQPLTYVLNYPEEEIKIYTAQIVGKENASDVTDKELKAYEIQVAKDNNLIDMEFLGMNLGDIPSNTFSKDESKKVSPLTLIIPVLSFVLSIIQTKMMNKNNSKVVQSDEQNDMQKSMNFMMPLLSASISYSMPLALGMYWLLGSVFGMIQQIVTKKIMSNDNIKDKSDNVLLISQKGGKNHE